jgi:hypothetical protein
MCTGSSWEECGGVQRNSLFFTCPSGFVNNKACGVCRGLAVLSCHIRACIMVVPRLSLEPEGGCWAATLLLLVNSSLLTAAPPPISAAVQSSHLPQGNVRQQGRVCGLPPPVCGVLLSHHLLGVQGWLHARQQPALR